MNFFITKNFNQNIDKKSNLILSPEFYWVKKITLDVRFTSEVKNMAESIFDGTLPKGDFDYKVFKLSKREYILAAYDMKSINLELQKLNIARKFIDKIYLAQSEFSQEGLSIFLDNDFGITFSEGIVLYAPRVFLKKSPYMQEVLKNKKLSSQYIYSSRFSGVKFYDKWLNFLLLVFVLCSFISLVDILKLKKNINFLEKTKSDTISKNSLPKSSFELKSLLDESERYEKTSVDIKNSLDYVSRFPLKKGEYFTYLRFQNNKIVCMLKFKNRQRRELFQKYISKNRKSTIKIELKR